jgi:hypothetical protein
VDDNVLMMTVDDVFNPLLLAHCYWPDPAELSSEELGARNRMLAC